MAQLFRPRATGLFRAGIVLAVLGAAALGASAYFYARSDSAWNVGKPAAQPIPFRHDLHAGALRIDCRYCHSTVERAADAGMPTAQTCMSCHSQVWTGASVLEPLRSALALNQPITWASVHRLPNFAYFNHAIHVQKGVACETCHGRVEDKARTVKAHTMSMGWCLDCHRDPLPYLRPKEQVFAAGWTPHEESLPEDVRAFYKEAAGRLTDCNTCHR
jgi:hypothetical protein